MQLIGYQILLNEDYEIRIGDHLVVFGSEENRIYDLHGKLESVVKSEISYYDRSSKVFTTRGSALAANFNTWYIDHLGTDIQTQAAYQCHWRWIRQRTGIFTHKYNYYHEGKFYVKPYPVGNAVLTNVYAIERDISDCTDCSEFPTNPYGGFVYNVSGVVYHCGTNSQANEDENGAWLRANFYFWVTSSARSFFVSHVDDVII